MKKQIRLLGIFILLSSACTTENKIQILPDAKLGQQYSVTIDFNDRISPDSFRVTISPEDSGLSVSGVTGPYDNETIISGTPKVKQDISIQISYFSPELHSGPFNNGDRKSYYLIKVEE